MTAAVVSFHHASRFYKTVIGVGDIHLELLPGAYGLIGPNGSGKTTLLNLVTGMLAPSLGTVRVFGQDPRTDRSILRRIGLCPATDILYPNISGIRWVQYLTALHGFSSPEARQLAEVALEKVGMCANMHRPIGSYSLGMRQRVKLAQAIAHHPDLLILDEPFNGLDPVGRRELADLLRNWIDEGSSLILASHVLHEVEAVTSAFLLIHGGRILATGDAHEVTQMLSGFPVEVQLTGSGLGLVAQQMAQQDWLTGMQFSESRENLTLRVRDRRPFLDMLANLATLPGVGIEKVDSPDGSLEAAFDLLLRVHRGEQGLN
ncbi:MAG: ABC transporter ATP-binding protein [Planctomycetales bacterium]|nr:ABC transporter ATP-binding protein [Planctomycetales bacterium]